MNHRENDEESFRRIFQETLLVDAELIVDDLSYQSIPEWDSVAQMALIAAFEQKYSILIDADDISTMSTVGKFRQTLSQYLNSNR